MTAIEQRYLDQGYVLPAHLTWDARRDCGAVRMTYSIVDSEGFAYIGNRHGEPQFEGDIRGPHCRVWRHRLSADRARDCLANLCQEEMRVVEREG